MEQENKRELWIDYVKAVACLAVLTFHVIYGMQNAGLECGTFLSACKILCGIFQIPVFMFASGYLFGKKKITSYVKFEGRKLWNLGIPYVVFSVVYYVINVSFQASVNFSYSLDNLLKIYITPLAQYWYIFATILIFLVLPILEKLIQNEFMLLLFLLVWKLVNSYWLSVTNYDYFFSQYAFYFYLGTLYSRHHKELTLKKEKTVTVFVSLLLFLVLFFSMYFYEWGSAVVIKEVFLAVLSIYLLTYFFETYEEKIGNRLIRTVAKYSFQIYLLHTMATAATRIVLVKLGLVSQWPQFILGWLVGLSATIFVAFLCEKTIYFNFFFFPERTVKELRKKKREGER